LSNLLIIQHQAMLPLHYKSSQLVREIDSLKLKGQMATNGGKQALAVIFVRTE